MGMDVYGRKPKNKKGEYFRNNVWWWHPLWHYCETVHHDIAQKVEDGHSNSGHGLDASDAYKLGIKLRQDYTSGLALEYEKRYMMDLDQLPTDSFSRNYPFSAENVKNFAEFCINSGGFNIH